MRFWNYQKGAICCDVYFSNSPLELTLLPDSVTCTMARVRKRRTIGGRAGGRGRKVCPILWLIREGKRCDASPIIELITQVPCWIIREFPLWTCAVNNLSVRMKCTSNTKPNRLLTPTCFIAGRLTAVVKVRYWIVTVSCRALVILKYYTETSYWGPIQQGMSFYSI